MYKTGIQSLMKQSNHYKYREWVIQLNMSWSKSENKVGLPPPPSTTRSEKVLGWLWLWPWARNLQRGKRKKISEAEHLSATEVFKSGSVSGTMAVTSAAWGIQRLFPHWLIYNAPVHSSEQLKGTGQAVVSRLTNPLITALPPTKHIHSATGEATLVGNKGAFLSDT